MIYLPKPKRNKMEICNDILSAIKAELTNGEAKPTRVQTLSNLAYDKFAKYLNELESKKMKTSNSSLVENFTENLHPRFSIIPSESTF
jgi:predicted transcriptional regulator